MALFGSARDISMFRYVNRELMGDIITQQVAYYKYILAETKTNMYGEAAGGKYFDGPVLLNCLIQISDQIYSTDGFGVDLSWAADFAFLMDDLKEANVVPEIGDILMFQEGYFEVDTLVNNQFFVGKDPDYPNEANPLNPGLSKFGWEVSTICKTHLVPADRVNIIKSRL